MKQTYNHAGVQIYHGDCRDLVLTEPADVMITDLPFSAQTHQGARTSKGGAKGGSVQVTFDPLAFGQLAAHHGGAEGNTGRSSRADCRRARSDNRLGTLVQVGTRRKHRR